MAHTKSTWGQLDILHNNVGISVAGGDAPVTEITVEAFDLIMAVNIRSVVLACKYAVPIMREQRSGSISTSRLWLFSIDIHGCPIRSANPG